MNPARYYNRVNLQKSTVYLRLYTNCLFHLQHKFIQVYGLTFSGSCQLLGCQQQLTSVFNHVADINITLRVNRKRAPSETFSSRITKYCVSFQLPPFYGSRLTRFVNVSILFHLSSVVSPRFSLRLFQFYIY